MLLTRRINEGEEWDSESEQWPSAELIHNTVNICLFPPLFFFSGLYYTDVLSALSVLYAYQCYLEKRYDYYAVLAGLLSLLFRQTNIFWVSLFLGGLAFCRAIPKGQADVDFSSDPGLYDVIQGSWKHSLAYDPLVSEASLEGCYCLPVYVDMGLLHPDYVKSGASMAIAGCLNSQNALRSVIPYLLILACFSGFVVTNGGVVLGMHQTKHSDDQFVHMF